MSITTTHYIDPDGDVDLLLPQLEELPSFLNNGLTCVAPAPGLDYRRSATQYSWAGDEPDEQPQQCEAPAEPEEEVVMASEDISYAYDITESEPTAVSQEPTAVSQEPTAVSQEPPTPENRATPEQASDTDRGPPADEHVISPALDETLLRIRTSSKHLSFSSLHFKRNLRSGMLESQTLRFRGHVEFRMDEQDHEAMLIVLNIIHGKSRQVPKVVDLDMLTKLAVMVDYLECLEVVEPYSDKWVDNLKGGIPETYSKELIQWHCISLVFRKEIEFKAVTSTAIRHSKDAIQTLGLPIRESLVDQINLRRYKALDGLFSALEGLPDNFLQDRIDCTFECNAMRYGALTKELSSRKLLFPRPQIPFLGYSIEDTTASIREIRDPKWCSGNNPSRSYYSSHCQSHGCQLTHYVESIIIATENDLEGLSLEDFP